MHPLFVNVLRPLVAKPGSKFVVIERVAAIVLLYLHGTFDFTLLAIPIREASDFYIEVPSGPHEPTIEVSAVVLLHGWKSKQRQ